MVVTYATASEAIASSVEYWEAHDAAAASSPFVAFGTRHSYSQLMYVIRNLYDPDMGEERLEAEELLSLQDTVDWTSDLPIFPYGRTKTYFNATAYAAEHGHPKKGLGEYKNPRMIYNSPLIHTVTLTNLTAGKAYTYRVAGSSRTFAFTYPHDHTAFAGGGEGGGYPWTVGLTSDLGQTEISRRNVDLLQAALERQTAAGKGSLVLLAGDLSYADGYYARWDSFARMAEPLAAAVPIMTTGGNHEIGAGEQWQSYNARYPMPHATSGSPSNLWWSRDVGPVHIISLCSYAGTAPGSLQHAWLVRDLCAIDRAKTPWVVAMMHVPWYNSNSGHVGEAELMRRDMEALLYNASVDVVISGHVHAYKRTHPVYNGVLDACGPIYLNLGDGGNREGAYVPWLMPQPSWSAFRESSFGVGLITFANDTHAWYNWTRSACESRNASAHHMGLDARRCATNTSHGPDNAEDPYAWTDPVWIVRGAARGGCLTSSLPSTTCEQAALPPSADVPSPPPSGSGEQPFWTNVDPQGRAASFGVGLISGMLLAAALWWACVTCHERRRPGAKSGPLRPSSRPMHQLNELSTAGAHGLAGESVSPVVGEDAVNVRVSS